VASTTLNWSSSGMNWTGNAIDDAYISSSTEYLVDTNTDIYWTGTSDNLVAATGRTSLELGSIATYLSTDYLASSTPYVATSTGDWLGTWQTHSPAYFYQASNPSSYIALTGLSASSPITYNNTTGAFTWTNPGFITSTSTTFYLNTNPAGFITSTSTAFYPNGTIIPYASTTGVQATLVSGTNIKTINSNSILGSGDLVISGDGGAATTTINTVAGPTFLFNTANDTNIGIAISSSSNTFTWTPSWIGTLADDRITSASNWNTKITTSSLSETIAGIDYNNSTGVFSTTAGYDSLVSTASGTTWNAKQDALGFTPLNPTNNLSDLNSTTTAKSNLGMANVENTALSSWLGTSNITTLGTIGNGTWQGTPILNAYIASSTEFLADNDTTYTAGTGMSLDGTEFNWSSSGMTWTGNAIPDAYISSSTEYLVDTDTHNEWGQDLYSTSTVEFASGTFSGAVTGSNLNIADWDTSFGWGDWSGEGFITNSVATLSSLTSIGTIGTGVWQGTPITNVYIASSTEYLIDTNTQLSQATVEDYAGGLWTGNTETLITVEYQAGDNTLDAIVNSDLSQYSNATSGFITSSALTNYMQDEDINTFSELQSWVSDEVLLKAGTLTDTKYCIYDSASGDIICNSTPGGAGTVTSVDMSVPAGFAISGNPITSAGTLALAFDAGYSLLTDASSTLFQTSYDWGDWNTNIDISTDTNLTAGRSLTLTGDDILADAELYTEGHGFTFLNATTTLNPFHQVRFPNDSTLTYFDCRTDGATIVFGADERASSTPGSAGTDVITGGSMSCSPTLNSTTSFANASMAQGGYLTFDADSNSSSSAVLYINYTFTKND